MAKAGKANPFRSFLETRETEPETEQVISSPEVDAEEAISDNALTLEVQPSLEIEKPLPPAAEPIVEVSSPPKKRGRQPGKRSNPDYIQVGAYIPKALDKAVKRKLLDEDIDFSDLVTKLLENWSSD